MCHHIFAAWPDAQLGSQFEKGQQTVNRLWARPPLKLAVALLVATTIALANVPRKLGYPQPQKWRAGDIVFLNGNSARSKIVRLLQGYCLDYSHVGIVVMDNGVPFVVNADPAQGRVVKQRWDAVVDPRQISGGAVFRVVNANLSQMNKASEVAEGYANDGVPFDSEFDLRTTDRLFCTEMVWRAYRCAGIDLCKDAETMHPHLLPEDLLKSHELQLVLRF